MCGLCGVLWNAHWADDGGGRRAHLLRIPLLARVLAHAGLEVRPWSGRMLVSDRMGRSTIVDDLPGLWAAAEALAGRPLDPLDPALVGAL